jgi:hypothetical protein
MTPAPVAPAIAMPVPARMALAGAAIDEEWTEF